MDFRDVFDGSSAWSLHHGDCIEWLKALPSDSFDCGLTDPPYEIGFLGRKWDRTGIAFSAVLWTEVYRVLKPGAWLLAFGGSRTSHRLTAAIEDAGFEIREPIIWMYGSGMPKSQDASKAVDIADGAMSEREVVGECTVNSNISAGGPVMGQPARGPVILKRTKGATAKSRKWDGWGTALRPSFEPITVARKPMIGTLAQNLDIYGVGALNIDACRVPRDWTDRGDSWLGSACSRNPGTGKIAAPPGIGIPAHPLGAWPANVIMSQSGEGCPVAALEDQRLGAGRYFTQFNNDPPFPPFFYHAKASTAERELGCGGLPKYDSRALVGREIGSAGAMNGRAGAGGRSRDGRANCHPTVKPLQLMRWLARLITPSNGVILEPFGGSGSTAMAAVLEGFRCCAAELDEKHVPIFEVRVKWALEESERTKVAQRSSQLNLFGGK